MVGLEDSRSVNRVFSRTTARFLAVSRFVRDRFVELGGDPTRVDVVLNGVDQDDYPVGGVAERSVACDALGLRREPFVVLFYGRVVPDKGIDTLLDVLEGLDSSHSVELLVVGPGADGDYAAQLVARTEKTTVHRLPMRPDVIGPLHAADLVVVPSKGEEAFGRTVIEALSRGRPVLASSVGAIPEILTGDFARFLVPPDDPVVLRKSIVALLGWRDDQPGLAEECSAHVAGRFSKRAMVDAVEHHLVDAAR